LEELAVCHALGVGGAATVERALWGARAVDLKRPLLLGDPGLDALRLESLAREETHALLAGAREGARGFTPPLVALLGGRGAGGAAGGLLFEATDGASGLLELRERARAGRPLSPREVGARVEGLCAALAALHAAGVTHGDLCLSNLLLRDDDGALLLIDLGSAWSARAPYCPRACRARPRYTSPERAAHAAHAAPDAEPPPWAAPPRAWAQDSFALGAAWHAWVTGEPPDVGAPPRAAALAALGWPPRWAEAVEALMAPSPEGRARPAEVGARDVLWGGAWW
ncbi:MAG: hypothetical protein FJ138_10865, partial [Deltaproteobacteria bacterium]|nr:hypothetical protein [Deltaproteobacteria bacterium]